MDIFFLGEKVDAAVSEKRRHWLEEGMTASLHSAESGGLDLVRPALGRMPGACICVCMYVGR